MTTLRKAAQQAREALKVAIDHYHTYHGHPGTKFQQAIDDLDAALAQQAEPVEPVRLQCVTCGTVYADGVPPQVPVQQQAEPLPAQRVHLICKTCMGIGYDSSGQRCEDCQP